MIALAGHGAAPVLFYEVVGWGLNPHFAIDERVIRDLWRAMFQPDVWTEELPLTQMQGWALRCLPNLSATLHRLGWGISEDGRTVCCRDADGRPRAGASQAQACGQA